MTTDVIVYLSSLNKQVPGRKVDTLMAFADGAKRAGARVLIETKYTYRPSKLAVILGWPSPNPSARNIVFRQEIVDKQAASKNHVMSIDANCFKFVDKDSAYLRYSIGGVWYDTSQYANKNSEPTRWQQLSRDFNLSLSPWKTEGDYILFLIQRDGGWGMKGLNPVEWARRKIAEVRKYTDLPIVLRPHPGKVADLRPIVIEGTRISDSTNISLIDDLRRAKAALVFNSSSGVAASLMGVPLFVDDSSSVCWDVANKNLNCLSNPTMFDRDQWIYDLAACHWTDEESRQGLVFNKFLPYLT